MVFQTEGSFQCELIPILVVFVMILFAVSFSSLQKLKLQYGSND